MDHSSNKTREARVANEGHSHKIAARKGWRSFITPKIVLPTSWKVVIPVDWKIVIPVGWRRITDMFRARAA